MARRPSRPKQQKEKFMRRPYFFKVLVHHFATELMVPPAFVKNFKGTLPTKVRLLSPNRAGSPPVTWNVKMKIKEGGCYFTAGWEKIVKELGLKFGDFLVFRLVSNDVLNVVAFDRTCCEKRIDIKSKGKAVEEGQDCAEMHDGDDSDEEEEGKSLAVRAPARPTSPSTSKGLRYPRVEKPLVKHEMSIFCLPTLVANKAGQWTKESALIKGSKGRKWRVAVKVRNSKRYRRVDFSTGWRVFIRDNDLSPGDTIRLDFKGGKENLVEAKVLSRASRSAKSQTPKH